jgi:hypothetical protein
MMIFMGSIRAAKVGLLLASIRVRITNPQRQSAGLRNPARRLLSFTLCKKQLHRFPTPALVLSASGRMSNAFWFPTPENIFFAIADYKSATRKRIRRWADRYAGGRRKSCAADGSYMETLNGFVKNYFTFTI